VKLLLLIAEMVLIVGGLLVAVGGLFYAICWVVLSAVQFFPLIGQRHRHPRWDELNQRSGRK
jgi:hypothetical protein